MSEQSRINVDVWSRDGFVADYANRRLSPAEVMLLVRYRDALAGRRVLELGCGAGRLSGYVVELGADLLGTDIAPEMVEYCRRTYPAGTFRVQDVRQLDGFDPETYDAVLAANNLLDILEDGERRLVLADIRRILAPGGLLLMSTHNRAYASRIPSPWSALRGRGKLHRWPRVPFWLRNRRRLRRYRREEADYAVLTDEAHGYRLLHYYIERDAQERQLAAEGLELVECLDGEGRPVSARERAPEHSELYYVARR